MSLTIVQIALGLLGLCVVACIAVVGTVRARRGALRTRGDGDSLAPPPWSPRADPFGEYAFDLLPVNRDVRVRVDTTSAEPGILDRAWASVAAGGTVTAVPAPQSDPSHVFLSVDGVVGQAGTLPPGYEHPVGEAYRRRGSIPIELWRAGDAYTLDLRTGLT